MSADDCRECGHQLDGFGHCMTCDTYGTPENQRADETDQVLVLILTERERQFKKWGVQNHSPAIWYAILGEEFGEVGKEICEHAAFTEKLLDQAGHDSHENRRLGNEIQASPHLPRLRTELVHLIAVGTAMLESLERNQGVPL